MKFVRESLFEFERGLDPKDAMNIGIIDKMKKDIDRFGLQPNEYEILPDLTIKLTGTSGHNQRWIRRDLDFISLKYTSPLKYKFVSSIKAEEIKSTRKVNVEESIDEALKDGISKEDIYKLLDDWAENKVAKTGQLYLTKQTRTTQEKEFDEEYNTYIFIGFTDKVPVTINGEKYYKDKFKSEAIIKIDTFSPEAHQMAHVMKIRARVQYSDGDVYIVKIPNFLMDEDRYESIPPECYDIFVKNKKKV
jgi:hypothetical protein